MDIQQQSFLRDTMRRLNLTREAFCSRIGVSRRAMDAWLLPAESQEFRRMPEIVERFVGEILITSANEYTQSVHNKNNTSHLYISHQGKPSLLTVDQFS